MLSKKRAISESFNLIDRYKHITIKENTLSNNNKEYHVTIQSSSFTYLFKLSHLYPFKTPQFFINNQTYKETVSHKQADWIEINKTIVRVEDVDTNADNYNSEETEIIEVCLGDILEVWLYDIKSHRGSIFTQYINTDDLEDWMDTSKKVSIKEIEKGKIDYQIFNNLAYGQWTMEEMKSGEMMGYL